MQGLMPFHAFWFDPMIRQVIYRSPAMGTRLIPSRQILIARLTILIQPSSWLLGMTLLWSLLNSQTTFSSTGDRKASNK